MTKAFPCGQPRLVLSVFLDVQADLSLYLGQIGQIAGFVMQRLKVYPLIKASVVIKTESILLTIPESVFSGVSITKNISLQNRDHHQSNQFQPTIPFYVSYITYFKHINLPLILAFKILYVYWEAKISIQVTKKIWSDCTDAQADLILHWAHISAHIHLYLYFRRRSLRKGNVCPVEKKVVEYLDTMLIGMKPEARCTWIRGSLLRFVVGTTHNYIVRDPR